MTDQPIGVPGTPPNGVEGVWNDEARYDLCRRVWELRVEGLPMKDIAIQLGVSRRTTTEYLNWWREHGEDEHGDNPIVARRLLNVARLDLLTEAYLPRALQGDDAATAMLLKIQEREAKLIGLDAAIKVDAQVSGKPPTPALLERIRAIKVLAEQQQAELEGNTIDGEAEEVSLDELPAGESA